MTTTTATKLRHAGDTGYSKSDETRSRIIRAALKMFGERGFEGASTRDIATAAGVNPPALQYHFNNKEGVYVACVEHIIKRVRDELDDVLTVGHEVADSQCDDETLIEAFCSIQKRFIDMILKAEESEGSREFMYREQAGLAPKVGNDLFYQGMTRPIMSVTTAIVGRLLGKPANDDETIFRTIAVSGLTEVFNSIHKSTAGHQGWGSLTNEQIRLIDQIVRESTVAMLRSMVLERTAA
jgi:AcrR family transcriptional regulator